MSTTTSLITVSQCVPLADSRQIALTLGIDHRSFFRMIVEYQEEIEQDFGKVRFEITPSGKTNQPQKYALLTEEQTYAYMSYSKNTVQSRACKRLLVSAFTQAKAQLQEAKPTPMIPDAMRKRAQANEDRVPHHLFSIGCELPRELPSQQKFQSAQLPDDAAIENSIRQCFWNDREKLGIPDSARHQYDHVTPGGRIIKAWAYSIEYLPFFRKWLREVYMVCRFDTYLRNRARRIAKQKQIGASDVRLLPQSEVA
ncbi:MAG: hypothetical protein E6J34_15550 [Chloroflexi bacterium]|nr:MAG: hypothetical protein E6J34_15550 [Chloroflexota bacterium]